MMMHPLERFMARFAADSFLQQAAVMPGLLPAHQQGLDILSGQGFRMLVSDILDQPNHPKAQELVAIFADVGEVLTVGGTILQKIFGWLGNSGFAWIWQIATILLNAFFHFPLPPIPAPPIPAPA